MVRLIPGDGNALSGVIGATWPTATAGAFDKTTWTYGTTTGLLLAKTDANNASVTYAYDAAGRMTSRTWARGVVTSYGYDAATGQLLSTTYSDSTPSVSYTYDRRGRMASVVDGVGTRTFTYTGYDQLAGEAIALTGFGTGSLGYTFDTYGRRTAVSPTLQRTGYSAFGQTWPYTYEAGTGLLASVGTANAFTYTYLANSALPSSIGSVNSESKELTWAAHRDELVAYDNGYSSGYSSAHRFEFARDAVSRVTMREQFKEGSSLGYDSFAYNARSELIADTGQTLSYDSQGNRQTGYGTSYQTNALNQYTSVGGATWTHDADGNPLSDGTQTYVYDAENRLVQATKGSMVFTFAYDYRHRLVKHTGHWQPWGGWGVSQPGTSWRLYDGDRIVLRSDTVGGYNQNAEYAWGRDLAGRHTSGDGTGGLLMVRSNGITYLPRHDGQGNLWGFSGGYSRSLKAFGQVTFTAQNVPVSVPIGLLAIAHGSKEYFGELGLYNYGRRFYDPKLGRFIGRDPIAEEGGRNLYRFVANNPVNRWDCLGLAYGDSHDENPAIPEGFYEVREGYACPFGSSIDPANEMLCRKDPSAPKAGRKKIERCNYLRDLTREQQLKHNQSVIYLNQVVANRDRMVRLYASLPEEEFWSQEYLGQILPDLWDFVVGMGPGNAGAIAETLNYYTYGFTRMSDDINRAIAENNYWEVAGEIADAALDALGIATRVTNSAILGISSTHLGIAIATIGLLTSVTINILHWRASSQYQEATISMLESEIAYAQDQSNRELMLLMNYSGIYGIEKCYDVL